MRKDESQQIDIDGSLNRDITLLGEILNDAIVGLEGAPAVAKFNALLDDAIALRNDKLEGGRAAFAKHFATLDSGALAKIAHAFTQQFHLINAAEEQHRVRVLRRRDRRDVPADGSIAAAFMELAKSGVTADEIRQLLKRLLIMPVLTAHPTEARRRTVLNHLGEIANAVDRLDDPRLGFRAREHVIERLREAILALYTSDLARSSRPTPLDEVTAGIHVFERSLLAQTPAVYREFEDALARYYPGESFDVAPFLRFGTWVGGDRDGNPNVTSEVTRIALERQRHLILESYVNEAEALGRLLSLSSRHVAADDALIDSLKKDRSRLPEIAARVSRYGIEPWREKMWFIRARLEATQIRAEAAYPSAEAYLEELRLLERSLTRAGLEPLALGRLRDARRRAEVFGFHLASMDLRQHSHVHERAVAELLAQSGVKDYAKLDEAARCKLLTEIVSRANFMRPERAISVETHELLETLKVVGRARRDSGAGACERYIVSFTNGVSDILEVIYLCRAANLSANELRPTPLLEQLEDLDRAAFIAEGMLQNAAVRAAIGDELEVMVGYSDSSKQAGYMASAVALQDAQHALAKVAADHKVTLTIFHGRGGAIGRGGGPANRTIRAQYPGALAGRLRVTEQGETVTARYGRAEIARRDMEQMVNAVLLASAPQKNATDEQSWPNKIALVKKAAIAARAAYDGLTSDQERIVAYAMAVTPMAEVMELPIASRPSSRRPGVTLADLRAIPWVFSWSQSRNGLPGWFGLGSGLELLIASDGIEKLCALYDSWLFFRGLIDNAQIALVRADMAVAREYAQLAEIKNRPLYDTIAAEFRRTEKAVLAITRSEQLLESWPTIARTIARRNARLDVLNHTQIELLRRLRNETGTAATQLREILFITINGIAAGLQTAG